MENQAEESLDGSSIKPVSSLRSHFEQMTTASTLKPSVAPPRPTSPKPLGYNRTGAINSPDERSSQSGLRAHVANGTLAAYPSPSATAGKRPISTGPITPLQLSPAVTVDPPRSPPKTSNANVSVPISSSLLGTDSPRTSSPSGSAFPSHFRIPSRPSTPHLVRPKSSLFPASQAPEPPPPRRSSELRRDSSTKMSMGPPPPVNRSEKPRMTSKPFVPKAVNSGLPASVTPPKLNSRVSPFNSPPQSSDSSPDRDILPAPKPRSRPATMDTQTRSRALEISFEPPPIHHSVVSKRRDKESVPTVRPLLAPQTTGDAPEHRPVLPVRNTAITPVSSRTSMDTMRPGMSPSTSSDALKLMKNGNFSPRPVENPPSFSTPPKRIFSTPTSQSQTPPRTHGRSMTVDQTSDRVPVQFRVAVNGQSAISNQPDSIIQSHGPNPPDQGIPITTQYPDSSRSNRRPPCFKQGPREIPTKYDTRLFDVCGDFICTSGSFTRVWDLRNGEQIMSLSHGESVKIVSLSFKPAPSFEEEGSRLWLGNNFGELLEIDIPSQSLAANKTNAHSRREVIKIYRHRKEMWTLDDAGTLHVWAPDESGSPNLESVPQSFRVPKGHSFSMVVGDELWHAAGKEIRIFVPTPDATTQFQILQRPLSQPTVGEVTSGAMIGNDPDRVYMGHNDGKVTIYSRRNYSCVGIVNISMYKINCLAGVGTFLWAAYNSGMVNVYDTTQAPWSVKKEWRAHDNPVINILSDRTSFWKLERCHVVTLGADNMLRPWDGLLQDDWLENEMQAHETSFCEFEQLKTLVMTWNAGASTPHSLRYAEQDSTFLRSLLRESDSPDILVFGFQELIDLEDKKTTAKNFFKSKKKDSSDQEHMSRQYRDWRDYLILSLDEHLPGEELYHLLHSSSLVGLFTCVFIKSRFRDRIKSLCGVEIKRGMGGLHGNKGALILRFLLDDTSMCFVNCHLAAGQTQTKDRNYDVSEILDSTALPVERDFKVRINSYTGGGDGTMVLDHEICVLNGDLNYRIDTMGRDAVVNAVKAGNLDKLLERDQLLVSKRKNPAFRLRAFHELPITFSPTYKYDVGTDNYDSSEKKRAPAWCDRIMYRCRARERIKQLTYRRHEVRVSDHRPVSALFYMTIKAISQKKRALVWEDCRRRFEDVKEQLGTESKLDFLTYMCNLDPQTSQKLLQQQDRIRR